MQCSSILPTWPHWLLLKAGISDPLPTLQGDRQQMSRLLGPSALCANQSLQPVRMGASPPPRQPKAQGGVTRMQACARWGMCLAGLPGRGWKCVGKIQK